MRTQAPVYTLYQMPETIFGIAPKLLMGSGGAAMVMMVVMLYVAPILSFITAIVTFAGGLFWSWRATRRDPHVETVLALSMGWWRGRRSRWMMGGRKP